VCNVSEYQQGPHVKREERGSESERERERERETRESVFVERERLERVWFLRERET